MLKNDFDDSEKYLKKNFYNSTTPKKNVQNQ